MCVQPCACSRFLSNRCEFPPPSVLLLLLNPRTSTPQPAELRLPPPERQQRNDPLCFTAEHWRAASFRQKTPRVSSLFHRVWLITGSRNRSSISVNTYRWQLMTAMRGGRGGVCLQVQWVCLLCVCGGRTVVEGWWQTQPRRHSWIYREDRGTLQV